MINLQLADLMGAPSPSSATINPSAPMSASFPIAADAPHTGRGFAIGSAGLFAFVYAALFAFMTAGITGPFAIDESLYIAMADAMAHHGSLAIQGNGGVESAPSLMFALSGYGADGLVYPQYPAGYAFIAAPFYLAAGVDGLFFLNAFAGLVAIFFVHDIARRLYRDARIALIAAALFAGCTYFATYAMAVWPHVLTLAILLGAASTTISGVEEGRFRYIKLATAGALIAAAASIRVDSVILFAPVFIWLRVFAAPGNRRVALAFLAGAVPFLTLECLMNFVKYGILSPVTYGEPTDYEKIGEYAPLAASTIVAAFLLLAFDISKIWARAQRLMESRSAKLASAAAALIAIAVLHHPLMRFAHHLWTLLVDLQAYDGDYYHDVLERDGKGFLTTFGLPKKAFLQSMPFFVITALPIADFLRGRRVREASFCLLFAAAPILFFSLKQWHGGYALNMRFFFAAVPFLSILSASAIASLMEAGNGAAKRFVYAFSFGFLGLLALYYSLIDFFPAYGVAATTYPALIFAAALGAACATNIARECAATRGALLVAAGLAVGASASSNFCDFMLTKHMRKPSGIADLYFSAVLPKGSLVVSYEETRLVETFIGGVSLFHPYDGEEASVAAAIRAFAGAGRCVYVRKGEIADFVTRAAGVSLTDAAANPPEVLNWFDTLSPVRAGCALP